MRRGEKFFTCTLCRNGNLRYYEWMCLSHHPEFKAVTAARTDGDGKPRRPIIRTDEDVIPAAELAKAKDAIKLAKLRERYADILAVWDKCEGDWRKISNEMHGYPVAVYSRCQAIKNHKLK